MRYLTLIGILILAGMGCTTTEKDAAIGGLSGAAIGGVIGHQSGNGVAGAAIGGVVGTVGGMVAGEHMSTKKFCPTCGRTYNEDQQLCPIDGTELKRKQE